MDRFYDEGWIDAPVRENKRGGAFCAYTVPTHHPYVLLNYTATPGDVLTLAHELGHAVDVSMFTAHDRETWLQVRGLEDHRWWPVPGASSDFASGAGDWAESFAHWLLDDTSQSELGEEPDSEELAVLADLVEG